MQPQEPTNQSGTITDGNMLEGFINSRQSLADIAEEKFDNLEANEESKKNEQAEPEEAIQETSENEEAEETTESNEDVAEAAEEDDDDGYYADEGLDESEPEVTRSDFQNNAGVPTDMGKYILDNLPQINVVGEQNGKVVNLTVKRAEDLPRDFQFTSEYDRQIFQQNIADQTQRAYQLMNQYNQSVQSQENAKFSQQEDREIQTDLADLQRDGELKKFKYAPNDRRFNEDPAVQEAQEVLSFMNEENQNRLNEANRTGRLISRLTFKDAYYLYRRQNPVNTPQQVQEDTQRKAASRKVAKAGRGTQEAQSRPRLPRNANIDQIISAYGIE